VCRGDDGDVEFGDRTQRRVKRKKEEGDVDDGEEGEAKGRWARVRFIVVLLV
jgi:hypothetical protein